MTAPVRDRYRTVSAYLICRDAEAVRAFAKAAFDASEVDEPIVLENRGLAHVALTIGDSVVMIGSPPEGMAEIPAMLHLYVEDCDATHARALAAGGSEMMPPALQAHGDRAGMVKDPGGNLWWIATPVEEVPAAEVAARMAAKGS